MKNLLLLVLPLLLLYCKKITPSPISPVSTPVSYTPPSFQDSAAYQKIQSALPAIEKIYQEYAEKNHYPSITFGVVVGNQLVFSGSTGLANLQTQAAASTQSVYRIASMSKSFTAMAILKLRDEGRLQLSDPVSKHIPEFGTVRPLTADAPVITVQHLMTMSAGFPEDNPWGDRQLSDTDEELVALVKKGISFSNVPGTNYEYSNLGFALLGKIITNVAGTPYQQYIVQHILQPLGMNDSHYEHSEVPPGQLALGYRWEQEQWKPEPILKDGSYGAMGGLWCSLEDFAKYVSLHLAAWPPRNEPDNGPVKRATIREMHQPWRFNNLFVDARGLDGEICPAAAGYGYGLGWRKDCSGRVRISHSGGLPGYGSEWRIYPEYGVGVVSFSNRTYGAPSMANARALDTLISIAGLKPRTLQAIPFLETIKEQLLKVLPAWQEAMPAGLFAENFFLDESVELRRQHTQKLFTEAGAIQKIGPVRPQNQLRGQFTLECENKNVEVFFTLTPEWVPMVQQLDIWTEEKK